MKNNYSALAPIYDRIMSHVEYDQWVSYIKKIIAAFCETPSPSVLEIGGGTGLLGGKLLECGMDYRGCDFSFAMCRQAALRGNPFFVADARCLPCKQTAFDLTLFLYDGINYLQSIEEYCVMFKQVQRCLRPGGLFLFDITTQSNSLNNFNEFVDSADFGDCFYFRRSYYLSESCLQCNDFTIFSKHLDTQCPTATALLYDKSTEHHAQKILSALTIKKAVPEASFQILGVWDGFSFKRQTSRSERVHFLLKKKAA